MYYACNNRNKKQLFSVRTKLPCSKFFDKKFISPRTEKNVKTHQQTSVFKSVSIRNQ